MIKKINKIQDFGIFNNFNWTTSIPDFKQYNLIYGWNYSGKTTLARIFRCFELGQLHNDYDAATFELEKNDGTTYDQLNLNQPFDVRVFNSDFVEDNLKWEGDIEPVILLGEENIKLQTQLEENKKTLVEKRKTIEEAQRAKRAKEEKIETELTKKAREIKNTLSIPDYDKTNLKPTVKGIASTPNTNLLSDKQKESYLTKYISTEKKEKIQAITLLIPDIHNLYEQTQALSTKTATANIIERLRKDKDIQKWVREGKELHKDKSHCEFCGGKLPDDLLDKLNAHFSADYENLLSSIDNLITNLEKNELNLYTTDETGVQVDLLPDKARFYQELQNDYEQSRANIQSEVKSFNTNIDQMIKDLQIKKTKPFEVLTIQQPQDNTNQLQTEMDKVKGIIQKHNDKTDRFEDDKKEAKEKLIKHWAI
jgi:wobble nucleotide-excising tRNase